VTVQRMKNPIPDSRIPNPESRFPNPTVRGAA